MISTRKLPALAGAGAGAIRSIDATSMRPFALRVPVARIRAPGFTPGLRASAACAA